jgi:hypothetical protein
MERTPCFWELKEQIARANIMELKCICHSWWWQYLHLACPLRHLNSGFTLWAPYFIPVQFICDLWQANWHKFSPASYRSPVNHPWIVWQAWTTSKALQVCCQFWDAALGWSHLCWGWLLLTLLFSIYQQNYMKSWYFSFHCNILCFFVILKFRIGDSLFSALIYVFLSSD